MQLFSASRPDQAARAVILQKSVLVMAGIAWLLVMRVGPIASLLSSPFPAHIELPGSIAFGVSAIYAIAMPATVGSLDAWLVNVWTMIGAICF